MEKEIKKRRDETELDNALEIIEWFDVSPERIFKAWTKRQDFISWYGPEGFTVPFCEMDVRVGGAWRACIKSPKGEEYWMQGKYLEITNPSRLVFTYGDGSGRGLMGETIVTIVIDRIGKKTRMIFRQTNFPTTELRDSHNGGWSSAFVCLGDFTAAEDTGKILPATEDAVSAITNLMAAVDDEKVNTVPYDGSWTAPQLLRHMSKSMKGMAKALQREAKPADRDPGERIEQLQNIFLDFSKKLTQPAFLIPEEQVYKKQTAMDELNMSFGEFKKNASGANLNELVEDLPLGPITKLEIIHFVLYHTQRHLHQMKKICDALKTK